MQSTFEELLILNGKMVETDHLTHLFPFNPFFIPYFPALEQNKEI